VATKPGEANTPPPARWDGTVVLTLPAR